jgi:aspartate-semialdehyde dehydrogenase
LANRNTIALVGSDSLLGREIRDIVSTSAPDLNLRLLAGGDEQPGKLTRVGDEPAIIAGLETENLADAAAVVLAGSAESSGKVLELAADSVVVIDLTYTAEDRPDARLRAPVVESEPEESDATVHVIAHPAAIALALFLRRLQAQEPVRRAVIQVLMPASEHGAAGVEELQHQTINLLSFKSLPQALFDTQLSFNLLARYGDEAPVALEASELRIERHLATLLALPGDGEGAPMPSLRVIQAPVFHGYSFSAWVQFDSNPGVETLESTLGSEFIDIRGADTEPPTTVGNAGQGGISVGAIEPDRNDAEACWFWIVVDNIRLLAENAVAVARQIV